MVVRFLVNHGSFRVGEEDAHLTESTVRKLLAVGAVQVVGGDQMVIPDYIQRWADLITTHEGWFPPSSSYPQGSVSWRHLNPGNAVLNGQYATFSTYDAGRQWLVGDLMAKAHKYQLWTLLQVMERYCPPPDGTPLNRGNNPTAYAQFVAAGLGVTINTVVANIQAAWVAQHRSYVPTAFAH